MSIGLKCLIKSWLYAQQFDFASQTLGLPRRRHSRPTFDYATQFDSLIQSFSGTASRPAQFMVPL